MTIVWNERLIAGEISRQTLARKCVVLVDNCSWTGHECDVLGITTDLRIIDVEVKISRADLKADARKDKWWYRLSYDEKIAAGIDPQDHDAWWKAGRAVEWPRKVWKHYYAMPAEIWKPELLDALPSPKSGVLLLRRQERGFPVVVQCERRAIPNKDADRLQLPQVMDVARLANLRMWDAYRDVERLGKDVEHWRQQARIAA